MKLFNFFKKPVVLHCYTDKPDVYNFSAIKEAKHFIPEWWKRAPKSYKESDNIFNSRDFPTIKGCSGFTDLYRQGVMLPMWSDCSVIVGEVGSNAFKYEYSNGYSHAQAHPESQRGGHYPDKNYLHLKFESEWALVCEEDVNFLLTAPIWNSDTPENLTVFPGILNIKYEPHVNINVLFKRENTAVKYFIPFGLPMVHLIPLTERKLVVKTHLISSVELNRIRAVSAKTKFLGMYRNNKKILQASKCPFKHKVEG